MFKPKLKRMIQITSTEANLTTTEENEVCHALMDTDKKQPSILDKNKLVYTIF